MADDTQKTNLITLTADIVAAHVANNNVPLGEIGGLIARVHGALAGLGEGPVPEPVEAQKPAVPVRGSVTPGHVVCLEDGKKLKMLKRHLMTEHGMTPAEYRAKWKLPADYPMVAPDYAETRRGLAVEIGLGRTNREPEAAPQPRRGRPPKTSA